MASFGIIYGSENRTGISETKLNHELTDVVRPSSAWGMRFHREAIQSIYQHNIHLPNAQHT